MPDATEIPAKLHDPLGEEETKRENTLADLQPELVPFSAEHRAGAVALTAAQGWPLRLEDLDLILANARGVAVVVHGRVVGLGLCATFGPVCALSGIVVDQEMRGSGLGRRIVSRLIDLAEGRAVRLIATDVARPLYESLGFGASGQVFQQQGIAVAQTPELPVETGSESAAPMLAVIDAQATGLSRPALIERVAREGRVLRAARGFALLHEFGKGMVVGPVIAEDEATARALLSEAATRCAGQWLRVDLTDDGALRDHARSLGLQDGDVGSDMARGTCPVPDGPAQAFALLTQSLL